MSTSSTFVGLPFRDHSTRNTACYLGSRSGSNSGFCSPSKTQTSSRDSALMSSTNYVLLSYLPNLQCQPKQEVTQSINNNFNEICKHLRNQKNSKCSKKQAIFGFYSLSCMSNCKCFTHMSDICAYFCHC